jgi:hypothetical protein
LDAWLPHFAPELLDGRGALVDVGFGESPVTTEEWARSVPGVRVVGIDQRAAESNEVELHVGSFEDVKKFAPVAVVRAMNVLRSYQAHEVAPARALMFDALIPGGLLIEGSSDTDGHVLVVSLSRGERGELLFHTDFTRGFSPWLFRDWLPRDLRRSVKPGTAVHTLFTDWSARTHGETPRARFENSLAAPLEWTEWERANGFVRWTFSR